MALRGALLGLLLLPAANALQAQAIKNEPPIRHFTEEEVAAVEMPAMAFEETPEIAKNYEKYFYFHRADTDFDTAYADLTECDALVSGISIYVGASDAAIASAMTQYGVAAGAVGGVIASVMMDAIFGSAERRKARRLNIRHCMFFKGYDRYGLEKELWQRFNFEEGLDREKPEAREAAFLKQAKVASGPKPQQEVLEP